MEFRMPGGQAFFPDLIFLIICKSTDKTVVEWSLKDINKPLGVATYKLREVVDRTMAEMKMKKKRKVT